MNTYRNYKSPIIEKILAGILDVDQEKTDKRMMLASRISTAMRGKGWKQKDLAIKLEKSPAEISRWLSGTHNFTIDTLFDLEKVLDIKLVMVEQTNTQSSLVLRGSVTTYPMAESTYTPNLGRLAAFHPGTITRTNISLSTKFSYAQNTEAPSRK